MPEGDTIFRAAQRLHQVMAGREVSRFEASASKLLNVDRVGRTVVGVRARGKHLLMDFDDGMILHSHLRMRGRWRVIRRWTSPIGRSSVVMALGKSMVLGVDLAIAELLKRESASPLLARLGPDLLATEFDADEALRRIRGVDALPIGVALMRQDVVGGIGNVYKSELLFLAKLDPFAPVSEVSDDALTALFADARRLMKRNLGTSMRTTRKRYEGRLWVYGRSTELCRTCGEPVAMKKQEGRSTYFCASCQQASC